MEVIKNFVLVLFIVLILHFLTKNIILQRSIVVSSNEEDVAKSVDVVNDTPKKETRKETPSERDTAKSKQVPCMKDSNTEVPNELNYPVPDQLQDLYDFVFDDKDAAIDQMFDKKVTELSPQDPKYRQSCDAGDVFYKKKTVCDAHETIEDIFKNNSKQTKQSSSKGGTSTYSILHEYNDETIMNGGTQHNLMGYDLNDESFSPI